MEDVIKHIMNMDQSAYDKKVQTEKRVLEKDEDFDHANEILSQEIVAKAKRGAERSYAAEIDKQAREIKSRDRETQKTVQAMELKYKQIEEKVCQGLLRQMFSMEE